MGEFEMKSFTMKNGEAFTVRSALPEDAEKVLNYNKEIFEEAPYLLTTTEEFNMTNEQEKEYLEQILLDPGKLALIAEAQEEMIGFLDFHNGHKIRNKHQGTLAMNVAQKYRNQGIGKALLSSLLDWAERSPLIEKVALEVVTENYPAIQLYRSLGFMEEGRKIKAIKVNQDTYYDVMLMARLLK
ncbi:GNAT family N-acetyltransferase [Paenibacillus jiagnxiensis]|uniref:GNAT family N-acetyltransferase n=1 Tax=Paenibacillus jiagnxiensis TaxID=3228926 RepID=UPI0033A375F5